MMMMRSVVIIAGLGLLAVTCVPQALAQGLTYDHRVLATTKTSTMEKEMNEAAAAGFVEVSPRFSCPLLKLEGGVS